MYWRLRLLLGAVGQGLVVRTAFGQAHIPHGLFHRVLVELLGAQEVDVGDRGALFHYHNQHIAIGFQAHVLEQAQREQGANGCRSLFVVVVIAHMQRHGRKDGARLYALQAFHTNVLDSEWVQSPRQLGKQHQRSCSRGLAKKRRRDGICHL